MAKFVHTCFEVADLKRSAAFYETTLGLEPVDEHTSVHAGEGLHLVYMRCRETGYELELLQWLDRDALPPAGKRETHIAVVVDDVDAEHARLVGLGVNLEPAVTDYRTSGELAGRYFYMWDPDGNTIEVMQRLGRFR